LVGLFVGYGSYLEYDFEEEVFFGLIPWLDILQYVVFCYLAFWYPMVSKISHVMGPPGRNAGWCFLGGFEFQSEISRFTLALGFFFDGCGLDFTARLKRIRVRLERFCRPFFDAIDMPVWKMALLLCWKAFLESSLCAGCIGWFLREPSLP